MHTPFSNISAERSVYHYSTFEITCRSQIPFDTREHTSFVMHTRLILALLKKVMIRTVPRKTCRCSDQKDDPTEVDTASPPEHPPAPRQLTFRALLVGLLVGSLLCCSNTYFGLQSGWWAFKSLCGSLCNSIGVHWCQSQGGGRG